MENKELMWMEKALRLSDEIARLQNDLTDAYKIENLRNHIKKLTFLEKIRLFIW